MSEAELLAVTDGIYDAATGGTPWQAVGVGLKNLVKARSISLMAGDVLAGQAEILCHAEIPEEAALAYRRYYRHVDLWTNRAAAAFARDTAAGMNARVLTSGEMLVPDAEFLRSEFYCDFGRHYGLRYVVGTVMPLGAAGAMPIGLHRPEGAERFGPAEKRLLEAILPHLRRALQLRHRLALAGAAGPGEPAPGLAALDALAMGVLVLDAEAQVVIANAAAEQIAARAGGALRLVRASGIHGGAGVVAAPPHLQDRVALQGLVRATALGGEAGGALRLRDAEGQPVLAVLVTPLPRRLAGAQGGMARVEGRALLLLRELDHAPGAPRAELLRDLFGLTRREAEIACALHGGRTKGAVAAARGLRETTIRTHVRAVLEKTGAANLRELERLLSSLDGL